MAVAVSASVKTGVLGRALLTSGTEVGTAGIAVVVAAGNSLGSTS